MSFIQILTFAVFYLAGLAMALPEPHKGMIDNDYVRDVGVVYSKPNFQGKSKFVFELKEQSECLVLYVPQRAC